MIFFNFDIFDSRKNNRDIYVPGTYTQSLAVIYADTKTIN